MSSYTTHGPLVRPAYITISNSNTRKRGIDAGKVQMFPWHLMQLNLQVCPDLASRGHGARLRGWLWQWQSLKVEEVAVAVGKAGEAAVMVAVAKEEEEAVIATVTAEEVVTVAVEMEEEEAGLVVVTVAEEDYAQHYAFRSWMIPVRLQAHHYR